MLGAKGLETVSDLLYYAPFRYEDRSNVKTIGELAPVLFPAKPPLLDVQVAV